MPLGPGSRTHSEEPTRQRTEEYRIPSDTRAAVFLELNDPDGVPRRVHVPGRTALVGRSPDCDLVIDREFVSKQHLRIFEGIVAIDISTNGVYLDGERITGGALVEGRPLQIGRSSISLLVQGEGAAPGVPPAHSSPDPAGALATRQAREFSNVIEQLKAELRTARQRVAELESGSGAAPAAAGASQSIELMQLREVVSQLKNQNAALKARVGAAEAELQSAKAQPAPAPSAPSDQSASGLLVFKLQREIAELKKRLGAAAAQAPVPPPSGQPPGTRSTPGTPPAAAQPPFGGGAGTQSPVERAFPGIVPPARDSFPGGGSASPAPSPGVAQGQGLTRLAQLADADIEATPMQAQGALQDFLLVEGYRLLRQFERVITRVAGGLIQLYQLHTMVPGMQGTLREYLGTVLRNPNDADSREAFLAYQRELGRWLVVALGSYREASTRFVQSLGDELTPEALLGDERVSKKKSDKQDAELWRRARQRLNLLQGGVVQERLDEFAREAAQRLSSQSESPDF